MGPGVFPEQGAEQTGNQSQAAASLFSSVESPGRGTAGGVTWAHGGCQGTPPSPCSKEEREGGVSTRSLTPLSPPPPPLAPPRTMVTSSRWRKGGVLRRRSHTTSTAAPPTSTQTKRQMTTTSPGLGLTGGCAAGARETPLPPRHCRASCPASELCGSSRGEGGLKTSSSSPHCHCPTPRRPSTHRDETRVSHPPWPGSHHAEPGGSRESSQPQRRMGRPGGALSSAAQSPLDPNCGGRVGGV